MKLFNILSYQFVIRRCFSNTILTFSLLIAIFACKKNLEKNPNKQAAEPTTIQDLQALLNKDASLNQAASMASLAERVADNYYVLTSTWQTMLAASGAGVRNALNHVWDREATDFGSWTNPYSAPIYRSNFVLDLVDKVDNGGNIILYNQVKGSALFYRAFAFLELAQLYCRPYSSSANTDPGIVMRLTSAILPLSYRPTVEQTYNQIIGDLKMAIDLLPETTLYSTQPNKAAAFGTLARTYINMRDYANAGRYADSCLKRRTGLLDFNSVTPGALPAFGSNPEVIFFNKDNGSGFLSTPNGRIDTILFSSYQLNDLRRAVFFVANSGVNANSYSFNGSYGRSLTDIFDGITTGEMYLIRAECAARAGDANTAIADLNKLMQKRWKASAWVPFVPTTAADALSKVLTERRKELVYRGQRWSDLRRFNLEGANITLKRILNNTEYTLPPGDLRWVLLIPQETIDFSGVVQNPR